MTTIDFNRALQDAKGASFEALPVGDYDVEIQKSDAVVSSNGKPMIKVTMRVVSGPYEKRPIINQFVFSAENPQAVAIFFRHMKAFGLGEEFFAGLGAVSSLDPVANALVGRRARVTVAHRDWQGETRNEIKAVKPYTGAPPSPMSAGPTGPAGPRPVGPPTGGPVAPPQFTGGPTAPPVAAPPLPPAAQPVAPPPPMTPPAGAVQSMPQPPTSPTEPTPAASPDPSAYETATGTPQPAPVEAPVAPPAPPTLPV